MRVELAVTYNLSLRPEVGTRAYIELAIIFLAHSEAHGDRDEDLSAC